MKAWFTVFAEINGRREQFDAFAEDAIDARKQAVRHFGAGAFILKIKWRRRQ